MVGIREERTGAHLVGRLPPLGNGEGLDHGNAQDEEHEQEGVQGLKLLFVERKRAGGREGGRGV